MKLISTQPHRKNRSVILPVVGEVMFDDNCCIEVSAVAAKELTSEEHAWIGLEIYGEAEPDLFSNEPAIDPAEEMKKLKKIDLVNLAEQAELPKSEWETLNKGEFIQYLVKHLNG